MLDENLGAQDSFDYNYNEDVISDGDYAPSLDPNTDVSYSDQRNKSPYHGSTGRPDYHQIDNNNVRNLIPLEHDWQSPKNVNRDHWERNGYHYEEHSDEKRRQYERQLADDNANQMKPMPRSRGSTPQRETNHSVSPSLIGNRSPVPPPRRNILYDSDARSSPYQERRSDNSDPFYYNSRPADDW